MKQLRLRLILLVASVLILSAFLLSMLALRHFEQDLPPEMARTVTAVSYSASEVMLKAMVYGVPLAEMVGVPEFLDAARRDNPSIAYMLVTDQNNSVLYENGFAALSDNVMLQRVVRVAPTEPSTETAGEFYNTSIPLVLKNQRFGTLHLGQRVALVEQKLREVSFDVIAVLVVAGLIALELLRFVLTFVIATPAEAMRGFLGGVRSGDFGAYLPHDQLGGIGQLSARFNAVIASLNGRYQRLQTMAQSRMADGRQLGQHIAGALAGYRFHAPGEQRTLAVAALDHIRWPFFLLIFADSLSLSFFPVFVGQFYTPDMAVARTFVIGLPISVFMFTWALSMPWAGMWSDRVGHRKAFVAGAAVTTVGLVLTAFSQSLYDLLLWRSLTALGYGLVFITTQSYVSNNTPPAQRTRGMAVFLSSFFAGSLSGSAIGGILADRLGYAPTILLSGLLSAAAALFVLRFLHTNTGTPAASRKNLSFNDFKLLLRNKKFVAITFLAAVPAKIALTGFLYYTAPLYLKLLGNNQSTTGRVMMAYGLAIIVLSPFVAKLADRFGRLRWFITLGGYAAAGAMFIVYAFDSTVGLLAAITLLGIAHAIGVSPQLALINDFCKEVVQEVGSGTATGIFRLIERLGNVCGPVIAGLLISQFGFNGAFFGMGLVCLVCTSCFAAMFFWFERPVRNGARGVGLTAKG